MKEQTSSSQLAARSSKTHKIQWLNLPGYKGETWNPIIGCSKVSEGCRNCYALKMAKRIAGIERASGRINYRATLMPDKNNIQNEWNGFTFMVEEQLVKPVSWKKQRVVFVCSMGDLFHENTPFENIDAVFSVMSDCDQHIYIVLTKRPQRIIDFINWKSSFGIPWRSKDNIWLGVSAENQEQANKRIPLLLQVPAAVRMVSIEPMLGPVDLTEVILSEELYNPLLGIGDISFTDFGIRKNIKLDWVIAGGESGPKARAMHPDWVRSIRAQCKAAGVPFFFKQWGEWLKDSEMTPEKVEELFKTGKDMSFFQGYRGFRVGRKAAGNLLDGEKYEEYPTTPSFTSNISSEQVSPPGQEGSVLAGAKAGVVDNKLNN